MPEGAGSGSGAPWDFEDRLGSALTKLKPDDLDVLKYHTGAKPVEFEKWIQLTRLNLESRHSQLVVWWDTMFDNAEAAYRAYLALPPLQRSNIRPTNDRFTSVSHQVERYMRRHVLRIVPENVQQCLLHVDGVTCADAIFQTMVDAGPGTESDRANTLNSVVSKGQPVAVSSIYEKLHRWRFDMARLHKLGVVTPDPTVQRNVLTHYVSKLAEANKEFEYRLNAYKMNRHLTGAVTQEQVDELWRYLVSEAREFHSSTAKESIRKAKTANSSSRKESDGFVPEGAGRPAGSQEQAKKQGDRRKGTGKGGVDKAGKKQQKGSRQR